jgi:hypothetical protein
MIRWDCPCRLEEFLEPTATFNWSVPDWMSTQLDTFADRTRDVKAVKSQYTLVEGLMQDHNGGYSQYDQLINGTDTQDTYGKIYHDLFRTIFQPSPPIAKLVNEQLKGLVPGQYSVGHFRAFYKLKKPASEEELEKGAIRAVNCASQLHPGVPIYFASESSFAMKAAQDYGRQLNHTIVINESTDDPLHLENECRGNVKRKISDYYQTFVDLLVMGNGRCVAHGQGGFGAFASLLSYNSSCIRQYDRRGGRGSCEWANSER